MFGKNRLRAARSHKLTTMVLSREIRIWKQYSHEEAVFSIIYVRKLDWKSFRTNPKSHKHWDAEAYEETHTLEAIFQVLRAAVKLSQRAWTRKKNRSTPKEYFGQTTNLKASVPWKALEGFFKQSNWRHEAQFIFIVCTTGTKKTSEELTSFEETYVLTNFGNKSMRKVHSESKLASKPIVVHIALSSTHFSWYASLWFTLKVLNFK